jgi:hypothetical protein
MLVVTANSSLPRYTGRTAISLARPIGQRAMKAARVSVGLGHKRSAAKDGFRLGYVT